ncbi:hypothetical protein V9K67_23775 [Paraflavisolibacter sp. H34]|uniref:hypothetical protein n=1 Tax=Huijunlia imazamoxiresistens TaxID=3127457 RepID=UPI00301990C2
MTNSMESLKVEFNNRASSVFFTTFSSFQTSIASLDRQGDENVFQQLRGRYATLLQQQLEGIARELISRSQAEPGTARLKEALPTMILEYTNDFCRKINSL